MKKFLVLAILLGGLLSPIKVKAQSLAASNRGSQAGYYFEGHSVADVLVKPHVEGGKSISVAKDPDYDDQVVYLYHPATGRFLYADGDWGTLAVVRYEGFGMPLNIVSSEGSDIKYGNVANQNKVNNTYGLYTESFDQGHYLGKDCTWSLGNGWFDYIDQKNEPIHNLRIYIDRGGEASKTGTDWWKEYTDYWDAELKCLKKQALLDCVFNWGFEKVDNAKNGSTVYRLYFYALNDNYYNNGFDTWEPYQDLHKHYIKVDSIDVLGDGLGCNMLTSAWRNTNGMPNTDETAPAGEEYYWQIVTRGDIKDKFKEDFKDPYSVNAISGNANYNLDNPDFSRPLTKTVNNGTTEFTDYWTSTDANFYIFDNLGTNNAEFGRYSSMQPEQNGSITQTFKSYQFGLYRLECQGFTTGNATATMSITSDDNDIKIGEKVDFEHLGSIADMHEIDSLLDEERGKLAENESERIAISRAVGKYFYADENKEKYMKYIYFYVPENYEKSDIKITLSFTGIDDNFEKNYAALDNVRLTYMGDAPYVLDEEQKDLESLAKSESSWIPVYMKRQFDVGAWNALVCPIPLNYGQLKSAFGEDMKLSEIEGLDADNPYVIKFSNVFEDGKTYADSEKGVKPGHFYLVKPSKVDYTTSIVKTSGTDNFETLEGVKLVFVGRHNLSSDKGPNDQASEKLEAARKATSPEDAYDDFHTEKLTPAPNSNHNAIELHGSYKQQTISKEDRGNCYVFATKENDTRLVHLNKEGGDFNLKAFRFYIKDVENNPNSASEAKSFSFVVDGVEDADEQAGIFNAVNNGNANGDGSIYTLAGQKVNGNLSKGIYVKNGKKFLVK